MFRRTILQFIGIQLVSDDEGFILENQCVLFLCDIGTVVAIVVSTFQLPDSSNENSIFWPSNSKVPLRVETSHASAGTFAPAFIRTHFECSRELVYCPISRRPFEKNIKLFENTTNEIPVINQWNEAHAHK